MNKEELEKEISKLVLLSYFLDTALIIYFIVLVRHFLLK